MTYHYWPQALVVAMFVLMAVSGICRHGKPLMNPTIDAGKIIFISAWFALVLGMGGFWDLR